MIKKITLYSTRNLIHNNFFSGWSTNHDFSVLKYLKKCWATIDPRLTDQQCGASQLLTPCLIVVGKSPIFLPLSPPQNLGIFGDFPSKKPRNLEFPHPQSVPEHSKSCNPVPIPEIWGFSGINPNKSPNFGLSPSPKYPQSVFKPCPCPYSFPKKTGRGWG